MVKTKRVLLSFAPILIVALALIGCGGGGGGSSSEGGGGGASIAVSPTDIDFGSVTLGNTPAPREVTITNSGSAALNVSSITSTDAVFSVDPNGGTNPCGSTSPTIAAGGSCTFEVTFQPAAATSYPDENIQISSNASNDSVYDLALSGSAVTITRLTVRINEVSLDCLAGVGPHTAYVSVTDQLGFPVTGLLEQDFVITLGGAGIDPTSVDFVANVSSSISIAAAMDYSSSITDNPTSVANMENGLVEFVGDLNSGDEMEIIKFDNVVEVIQAFTADTDLITDAILAPFDEGDFTRLNDALFLAVTNASARGNDRKAVIAVTDGTNVDPPPPALPSTYTLGDVRNEAIRLGIPIFPIGIGSDVNTTELEDLAEQTGGQYFPAPTSDNLRTIYQQLSSVLLENQYVIVFDAAIGAVGQDLVINVTKSGATGDATREVGCP